MVVVKDEIRSQIVSVASKIFSRYGFKKTTMEEIALASRKGKSSIYYYFKSKEEIFNAVVEKEAEELREELVTTLNAYNTPMEKLKAYVLFRLHNIRTMANFHAALKHEYFSQMDFIMKIRKQFDRDELTLVRNILDSGIREGAFLINDPEIGAIAISTMMKGLEVPLFLNKERKEEREKLLDDLIKVIFYGLIKR